MNASQTVHVVDDDAGMRDALTLLLQGAGFTAIPHASAEAFLAEVDCCAPVCLLVDLRLPGMDGAALYRHLARRSLDPVVVVISGYGDVPTAVALLKEGVFDFVVKPFDPASLLQTVRAAVARAAITREQKAATEYVELRRATLTQRELEVFELLAEGCPNKLIAAKLGMSVRTAEHHRRQVMEKMGTRSFPELIKMVLGTQRFQYVAVHHGLGSRLAARDSAPPMPGTSETWAANMEWP